MRLHLGCGKKDLGKEWKHFDIRKVDEHIDYVGKADDLHFFGDESVDEIYACHLLEHFGRWQVESVLKEWHRVLKKRGVLRIAVPDFGAIVDEYLSSQNLSSIKGLLYGGQDYEYNYHYNTFDFSSLKETLEKVGFYDVKRYDWRSFLPPDYDDYSRSYIPHMDFERGRLMSLNVVSKKG